MAQKLRETEELIEKYTCYIDGKVPLSPTAVQALEEELKKRSFRRIGPGKLLKIFTRCSRYPGLFS